MSGNKIRIKLNGFDVVFSYNANAFNVINFFTLFLYSWFPMGHFKALSEDLIPGNQ